MEKIKNLAARALLACLESGIADTAIILFAFFSLYLAQENGDMSIFSASGGIMTIFGLFKMIRFSTIEEYLKLEDTVQNTTGMTGPPVGPDEQERIRERARKEKREKLEKQLRAEFTGIVLTIVGTIIASYGSFIPLF